MASSRDRQRKLAREKFDRQLARRAERERRRRRIYAGVGTGLAVLLVVAGVAWIGGAFDGDDATETSSAGDTCLWTPLNKTSNPDLKDVGTPPTKDLPEDGTQTLTVTTNQGAPIVASLDVAASPCAAASLSYLAGKGFYDNTDCHEITTDGALRCGDPSGTGNGGPTYSFYDENLPAAPEPAPSASAPAADEPVLYPKGTVALVGNPPGSNGSQFLVFLKDSTPAQPLYSIVGQVTGGLETLDKIAKIATVENSTGDKVKPKDKITIQSLTVGAAPEAAPSASAQS